MALLRTPRVVSAIVVAFAAALGLVSGAAAQTWVDYATVSMTNATTPKLVANRVCYSDGTDLACDGAAGLLTSSGTLSLTGLSVSSLGAGNINASGVVSASSLYVSTTLRVSGSGYVSDLVISGVAGGAGASYSTSQTETDPQVGSLTANKWCVANSGGTAIDCASDAPAGALSGLTDVTLSGAASGEVLTYNGSKWVNAAAASTLTDRISTSGVASGATLGMVVADKGTVSFTLGGTAGAAYLSAGGILVGPGISATTNQSSFTTLYASGDVKVAGNVSASVISATALQLVSQSTSIACNASNSGALRYNSPTTTMELCTGTGWVPMGVGVPAGTIAAFASTTCPTGWSEYTTARGRFLRGIDNGAGIDPSGTRTPGATQDDAVGPHSHTMPTINNRNTNAGGSEYLVDSVYNGNSLSTNSATGSTETRPRNVAVTFCVFNGTSNGWNNPIAGGSTTPGGNSTNVQYNQAGVFTGSDNFTWTNASSLLSITGTTSSTNLYGQYASFTTLTVGGVAVTGGASADRIISTSANVVAGNGGTISFTTGGVSGTAYLTTGGLLVGPGISATTNQSSFTTIYASGNVGIGMTGASYPLDVSGSLRSSGEMVAYGNANAMRMVYGNYGSLLRNDATNFYLLFTASGDQFGSWNTLRPLMVSRASGTVYLANNALYVENANDGGAVGIGTTSPNAKLEVNGLVSATSLDIASSPAGSTSGTIYKNGNPFIHTYAPSGATGVNTFVGMYSASPVSLTGTGSNASHNTSLGQYTLRNLTSGNYNVANGAGALYVNTTGNQNVAVGAYPLYANTTGSQNVAVGAFAISYNSVGHHNTAVGANSAYGVNGVSIITDTTLLGYYTGYNLTTSQRNTLVGAYAGRYLTTGSNNILVGFNAQTSAGVVSDTTNNYLNIGDAISGTMETTGSLAFIGGIKANGIVTATYFEGNGSRLTNISAGSISGLAADRISTSGVASGANLGMVVADKGTVSFTLGGTAGAAYFSTAGVLVGPGISATSNRSSFTTIYASGVISGSMVSSTNLSTSLIQVGSGSGATCDSARKGAMRYNSTSSTMEFCNATTWTDMGPSSSSPASFSVAKGGTDQTVTTNTWVQLTWNTENFDTNDDFASNVFTPTVPGKYLFILSVECSSVTTTCRSGVAKNGSIAAYDVQYGSGTLYSHASIIMDMNGTTDYASAYAHNGGGTVISGLAGHTFFTGTYLGPQSGSSGGSGAPGGNNTSVQYNNGGGLSGSDNFTWNNASGLLTITGTTSSTNLYAQYASFTTLTVGGIPVTGGANTDRIISTSANVVAGNGGTISFTTGGVSGTAYFDTTGRLTLPGISATTNQSSFTTVYATSYKVAAGNGAGLNFWNNSNYSIYMAAYNYSGAGRLDSTSDYNMYFRMASGTNRGFVFQSNTTPVFQIDGEGSLWTTNGEFYDANAGNVQATAYLHSSDLTLKKNVTQVEDARRLLDGLRGVRFEWKANDKPAYGVIAQEVQKVMPEAVSTGSNGKLVVDYDQLVAPLIEAVKKQQRDIDDLRKQVDELRRARGG